MKFIRIDKRLSHYFFLFFTSWTTTEDFGLCRPIKLKTFEWIRVCWKNSGERNWVTADCAVKAQTSSFVWFYSGQKEETGAGNAHWVLDRVDEAPTDEKISRQTDRQRQVSWGWGLHLTWWYCRNMCNLGCSLHLYVYKYIEICIYILIDVFIFLLEPSVD